MVAAPPPASRNPRRARLGLLELGAKVVPAVVLTPLDLDGDGAADDVRITGDAGPNAIAITDDGDTSARVQIDANGDGDTTDPGDRDQVVTFTGDSWVVEARLGGGADVFEYAVGADFVGSARVMTVDLGAGNDRFGWIANGHAATAASRLRLDLTAGPGADQGQLVVATVDASTVSVRADWGPGPDAFESGFGPIDGGAAVDVAADLGGGTNSYTATFDGVGKFDAAALDVAIIGGPRTDLVNVQLGDDVGNGTRASRAAVAADLGAGDDAFSAGFVASEFKVDNLSQASIVARGGAGNDYLLVGPSGAGTSRVDAGGRLAVALDGGAGADFLAVTFPNPNAWYLEAGATLQVRLDGGTGADGLSCRLSSTAATTGDFDVAVRAGAGDDGVTFGFLAGGNTGFGPAGGVVLDGGTGADLLTTLNPAVTHVAGFETVL